MSIQIITVLIVLFFPRFIAAEICTSACPPLPPESCVERDRAIWEQPVCPCPSGEPISYGRLLEGAIVQIKPYGYVKAEPLWDTRQSVGFREEQETLFPRPQILDVYGVDINARSKWHITAIESRIGLALYGPAWGCYTTDGLIEGDFRGPFEDSNASFRLRHAFGRISWDSGSFLFGQYWHPLFVIECFPHTVAFSIGAPLEPQAREPQLRLTQRWKSLECIFSLSSQRDFASNGPNGISTEYIRNAVTPNVTLQARGYLDRHIIGATFDYLRLAPRIVSNKNISVKEFINSFTVEGFGAFIHPPWSLRVKAFWSQNGNNQLLLSGFGVRTIDVDTDRRIYSNIALAGAWLDFSYLFGCDDKELGVFLGGGKNLGSSERLYVDPTTGLPIIYGLTEFGPFIDYVARVAPRFIVKKDPFRFGLEVDITRTLFGTPNSFGKVPQGVAVTNARFLLAFYYMF